MISKLLSWYLSLNSLQSYNGCFNLSISISKLCICYQHVYVITKRSILTFLRIEKFVHQPFPFIEVNFSCKRSQRRFDGQSWIIRNTSTMWGLAWLLLLHYHNATMSGRVSKDVKMNVFWRVSFSIDSIKKFNSSPRN